SFVSSPPPTAIYTLRLHDALPISASGTGGVRRPLPGRPPGQTQRGCGPRRPGRSPRPPRAYGPAPGDPLGGAGVHVVVGVAVHKDRKSTRLNSSHVNISYAVFCLT